MFTGHIGNPAERGHRRREPAGGDGAQRHLTNLVDRRPSRQRSARVRANRSFRERTDRDCELDEPEFSFPQWSRLGDRCSERVLSTRNHRKAVAETRVDIWQMFRHRTSIARRNESESQGPR
jgi:hypothetical protein